LSELTQKQVFLFYHVNVTAASTYLIIMPETVKTCRIGDKH